MTAPRSPEPETVAGRRLLEADPEDVWLLRDILAIEAEARAEAFAEIRQGVEGLLGVGVPTAGRSAFVSRAAVLALLPAVPPDSEP